MSGRLLLAVALARARRHAADVESFAAYAQAPLGLALGLIAGIGWAVGTLILQRGQVHVPATVLTGWQLLITALPITIGAFALGDHQWFMPSWSSIADHRLHRAGADVHRQLCWFSIVGLLPAHVAGLSSILVPVVAMVSGAVDARRAARPRAVAGDGVFGGGDVARVAQAEQGGGDRSAEEKARAGARRAAVRCAWCGCAASRPATRPTGACG